MSLIPPQLSAKQIRPACSWPAPQSDASKASYSETVMTEFRPPKGLATLSLALGSGRH